MPLTQSQCRSFNEFLFRRTPDWDRMLSRDRFPYNYTYNGLYKAAPWESQTGTTHTWDQVHISRINDNGCWDAVNIDNCVGAPCAPNRSYVGWGSTRNTYGKFHKDFVTPPFCFDQLRDTEMATDQLNQIVNGLKKEPDQILSDYLRMWIPQSAGQIFIAGNADLRIPVTSAMFTNSCTRIDLGGSGNLPTSKLTIEYLNNHYEELLSQGYFDQDFNPAGLMTVFSDIQTWQENANANPALTQMYNAADFAKGGKFYSYGVMRGVGNFLFKLDPEQLRFQDLGNGVLQRVFPYENVATTVGKMPQYSLAYKNAPYAAYHVYNPAARTVYTPMAEPVNGDMKFNTNRVFNGRWSWKAPDFFNYTDPNTGITCGMTNDKGNMGYFLGEFEIAVKTEFPLTEMWIIAQREPQVIVDNPRCAALPSTATQHLLPYNTLCGDPDLG